MIMSNMRHITVLAIMMSAAGASIVGTGAFGKAAESDVRPSMTGEPESFNSEGKDEGLEALTSEQAKETVAVEIPTLKNFSYVMEHIADKKIVYMGESHTRYSDHVMELNLIKHLNERGANIAIGMEMFQRPFQTAVDAYIEGKTDEREFLRATEYFKRWGYDYRLYRPILQFARQKGIPVVALNARNEIVEKVFHGGFDSLSQEERKSLPSRMDLSDQPYKERLEKIFKEHEVVQGGNFSFFYQAQILWDETMAESIARFLQTRPDCIMIVLVGSGHLAFGDGIPKRVAARNGHSHAILLNGEDPEMNIADYVFFSPDVPFVPSPMLMVSLVEKEGKVRVAGFPHGSLAKAGGLKVGDIILSMGNTPILSIEDVKLELLYRKRGEKIEIRVRRGHWLLGKKEITLEVALPGS